MTAHHLSRRVPSSAPSRSLAAVALVFSLAPVALAAQEAPALDRLEVVLWPEYDRPSVLVMLRGFLAESAPLPATVALRIPEHVGMPHAVAKGGADNKLLVAPYTRQVAESWATIEIATDSRRIHLEYYADLTKEGTRRSFSYTWPGGIAVGQLVYEVQEPRGAVEFEVRPPSSRQSVGTDGLVYHLAELGAVESEGSVTVQLSYDKAVPGLTTSALKPSHAADEEAAAQAPAPAAVPAPTADGRGAPLWPVLLLLVVVVGIVTAWVAVSRRRGTAASEAETSDDD